MAVEGKGKGYEECQIVDRRRVPYSDRAVDELLRRKGNR